MEWGLSVLVRRVCRSPPICLNPCSNRMGIEYPKTYNMTRESIGLNPCSNGMGIEPWSWPPSLPLVLSLNPCSNGMGIERNGSDHDRH